MEPLLGDVGGRPHRSTAFGRRQDLGDPEDAPVPLAVLGPVRQDGAHLADGTQLPCQGEEFRSGLAFRRSAGHRGTLRASDQ
ncbi:hypothetical protein [Streptomyces formicae]|uniref:hypothetical protein n=1 Tax=Streptomyces formicae TaxID=1616117 RepID=UPI000BF26386|nr:hypothetical protein [Streptomyces formicae]